LKDAFRIADLVVIALVDGPTCARFEGLAVVRWRKLPPMQTECSPEREMNFYVLMLI